MSGKRKAADSPRMVVIEGPEKGRVVPLRAGTIIIGRSKGDVVIQDPRISRSHVAIHVDETSGIVSFTDLKSLNGVQLNGSNKAAGDLKDGDQLQVGNTTFDCQTGVAEDALTEPAIAFKKRKHERAEVQPQRRTEDTDASAVNFASDLPPEPSQIAEPALNAAPAKRQSRLALYYRNSSKRTRLYGGLIVFLLLVLIFVPNPQKSGERSSNVVDRDFASIRELESRGKFTEAATQAEKIKVNQPTNPSVHRLLGELYEKQQFWQQSVEAYRRAFDLDASQIELLPKMARLHLTAGNIQGAQGVNAEIDHTITKAPDSREFFVAVANLYLDFPKLEQRSEKMIIIGHAIQTRYAPDDPSGFKLEALGHIDQGQTEEAQRVLEKAKAAFPRDETIYPYLALSRVRMKDFAGANATVQQWIGLFPQSLQPLVLMGQLKYQLKEFDESMKYLQRAVQLGAARPTDTQYPKALYLLGVLYQEQNQIAEAENSLRRSCEMGWTESCDHSLVQGSASTSQLIPPGGAARAPNSIKKTKKKKRKARHK